MGREAHLYFPYSPEDMGRAGMRVCYIDGTIYFMGGDHDRPVCLPGNPYDGHTLAEQLEQVQILTGIKP